MPSQRPRSRPQPTARPSGRPQQQQGASVTSSISALDAKIKLISQRIKIVENNLQVMSRTMVSHNKKLKDIEAAVAAGGGGKVDLDAIKKTLREQLQSDIASAQTPATPLMIDDYNRSGGGAAPEGVKELKKELAELRAQVSEMKYVVDTLNPMEYVTLEDINDVIDRKIRAMKD